MSSSDFIIKLKYESMNNNLRKKTAGNRTTTIKINAIRNIQQYDEYDEPECKNWFGIKFTETEIEKYPDAKMDDTIPDCNYLCIDPHKIYSGGLFLEGEYEYVLCDKCNCEKNPHCIQVLKDVSSSRIYTGDKLFEQGKYDFIECSVCGVDVDVNKDVCNDDIPPINILPNNPNIPSLPLKSTKPNDKKPVTTTPFCGECFNIPPPNIYTGDGPIPESQRHLYTHVDCKSCGITYNLCNPPQQPQPPVEPTTAAPEYMPYIHINPTAHKNQYSRMNSICKKQKEYKEMNPPPLPSEEVYVNGAGEFVNKWYIYDGTIPIDDDTTAYDAGYKYVVCNNCMDVGPNEIRIEGIEKAVNKNEIYDAQTCVNELTEITECRMCGNYYEDDDIINKKIHGICNGPALDICGNFKYVTCSSCSNKSNKITMQFTNNYILPPEIPPSKYVNNVGFVNTEDIYYGTDENNETLEYSVENIPNKFKYVISELCTPSSSSTPPSQLCPPTPECALNIEYKNPFKPLLMNVIEPTPEYILVNGVGIVKTEEIYDGSTHITDSTTAYDAGYKYVACNHCMDVGPNELLVTNFTTTPPTEYVINKKSVYNGDPSIQDNSTAHNEGFHLWNTQQSTHPR
jgi:hypothetical protein